MVIVNTLVTLLLRGWGVLMNLPICDALRHKLSYKNE